MINLSNDQKNAIDEFTEFMVDPDESSMCITGSAGTGKTFLTRYIMDYLYSDELKLTKLICNDERTWTTYMSATTNKAAEVLQDKTGIKTSTIHSLLGLRVKTDFKTGKQKLSISDNTQALRNSLLFVDEASMINKELEALINKYTYKTKIVYIGDAYQLAPVKENNSPVFESVQRQARLQEIQRQVAGSPIIGLGTEFRDALDTQKFPTIGSRGPEVQHVDGATFKAMVEDSFAHAHTPNKIVAWTNNRVNQYNEHIRAFQGRSKEFECGEYVVVNSPYITGGVIVYNTDHIGQVTKVTPMQKFDMEGWLVQLDGSHSVFVADDPAEHAYKMKCHAKLKKWGDYYQLKEGVADLRSVHASTVHKSQGSTYNTVFVDVADIGRNTKWHEIARLMYVAITRASDRVVLYGDLPERLYTGINKNSSASKLVLA